MEKIIRTVAYLKNHTPPEVGAVDADTVLKDRLK